MPSSISEGIRGQSDGPAFQVQDVTDDEEDIYRGDPPPARPSSSSSSSTSSASESLLAGGRLGAIAAVVELAISRWARARSSSSSTSSVSTTTLDRSQTARRRRQRPSLSNIQSLQSERDITARIKAREEFRQSPREFALYLPPSLGSGYKADRAAEGDTQVPAHQLQGIPFTTSLPLILDRLDSVMKKSIKARHNHGRTRAHKARDRLSSPPRLHHHYMLPDDMQSHTRPPDPTDAPALPGLHKGKQKDAITSKSQFRSVSDDHVWWLDVSSPTWEDMRALGKLLHLHPLTLEDILHQDPREKLELFTKLGYYFIVFRAIESSKTRERFQKVTADHDSNTLNEGLLGDSTVYLVVFKDGICTFHFSDISEHIVRVKNRFFRPDRNLRRSSAWIAHGILDSVVDSFFPYLDEVEKEVSRMENLVFSDNDEGNTNTFKADTKLPASPSPQPILVDSEKVEATAVDEKHGPTTETVKKKIILSTPRQLPSFHVLRRSRRFIQSMLPSISFTHDSKSISTAVTLRRLAKTRRLVTSLSRLLATKSEVVAQIRKRLLTQDSSGLGKDIDVAIYMGDVQDHILSLQHSLTHYERMLSQSHPTYLSQLSINVAQVKSGSDKAVMALTIISMAILLSQILIGLLSLNVTLPANAPDGPYNIFYIVIALCVLITCGFLFVVRLWWLQSKRKRAVVLK